MGCRDSEVDVCSEACAGCTCRSPERGSLGRSAAGAESCGLTRWTRACSGKGEQRRQVHEAGEGVQPGIQV